MMNENNDVFTMEDEPIATVVQNMRKGSKWLSAFLESYRPPLDGERYLTDREVADLLRVSRRTLQEYRNNRVLPFILLGGKDFTPNRDCANCWRRITASRWNKGSLKTKKRKRTTQIGLSVSFLLAHMRVQQYPAFPFCINITYACRFSLESALFTSHVRNTCVQ